MPEIGSSASSSPSDTLSQEVAAALRQAIWDGVYPCGERLIELTLAHEMRVSQNTIRDALRLLEQEGWVTRQVRRGIYVRVFTADEAEEVYELWALLEPWLFGWVMGRISRVEVLATLRPPVTKARDFLAAEHWFGAWGALLDFHRALLGLCERPQTRAILTRLHNHARLLDVDHDYHQSRSPQQVEQRVVAYEQLLGVIKFADAEVAQQALAERILENGKPIVRWLAMNG